MLYRLARRIIEDNFNSGNIKEVSFLYCDQLVWYLEWDSNPQAFQRRILSPPCLPVSASKHKSLSKSTAFLRLGATR